MKKSVVLGTVLALSLAVIIAVAAVVPALAHVKKSGPTFYSTGGQVILQLPPGGGALATRPTDFKIFVDHFNRQSDFGAFDQIIISRWIPATNSFMPIAIITDNNDTAYLNLLKDAYAGLPVWHSGGAPTFENILPVDDEQLDVSSHGDVVTADLKVPVSISLSDGVGGNFTLPPMTVVFRGIDATYSRQSTSKLLPTPPLSGYVIEFSSKDKPAWASIEIPAWFKDTSFEFVGIINVHETMTYIAPPP
jgi:hypothetical protein